MRGRARLVLCVGIALAMPLAEARAQTVGPDEARLQAAAELARTHEGVSLRWNLGAGTPARIRFAAPVALDGASPEECAARFLDGLAPLFEPGLRAGELVPASGPGLALRGTKDLGGGRLRVDFEEVSNGAPVLDSSVFVELSRTASGFAAVEVAGHYFPGVSAGGFSSEVEASIPSRFPDWKQGKLTARTTFARAVVPSSEGWRSAFAVLATVEGTAWRILVDAQTGAEISRTPFSCAGSVTGYCYRTDPGSTPLGPQPLPSLYVNQGATQVTTDAQGNHNLAGSVAINQLTGPLLHVYVDGQNELTYSGAADAVLDYGDASYHTDEVAAWYHLHVYNAYFQKTYPGSTAAATVRLGVLVSSSFANAFFSPTPSSFEGESFTGYIDYGTFGGRSACRDATVARHEYTHYLMNSLAYLYGSLEAGGINEGLADYFPCCELESPLVGSFVLPPRMRTLDNKLTWPQDNNGDVHRVGNILNGALWAARTRADAARAGDRLRIDQTVYAGLLRFPKTPKLLDARDAIVAADAALNGGGYTSLIEQALYEHGIGPAPATPPPATPPALPNAAPVFGPLSDQVVALGSALDVTVTATDPNGDPVTLAASPLAGSTFAQSSTKPASAVFHFKPAQLGAVRETFTASDGMLSTSATITIRVVPSTGGVAPTTSGTPGTAAPGATAAAAKGGGSGGGGCELAPGGTDALAWIPCAFVAALAALRRRR